MPSRFSRSSGASLVLALAALALASGCGVKHLEPPNAPPREVPKDLDLPTEPPAQGTGRLVIDAHGDKARVVEITGATTATAGNAFATVVGVRPVCTTPCVVDLPYGSHPLVFHSTTDEERMSEVDVNVGPRSKVVRHTLGERKGSGAVRALGAVTMTLGITAVVVGAIFWGTGALRSNNQDSRDVIGVGQLITGLGAAGVGVSIPLFMLDRPTERPGATTEWHVPGEKALEPSSAPGTTAQSM